MDCVIRCRRTSLVIAACAFAAFSAGCASSPATEAHRVIAVEDRRVYRSTDNGVQTTFNAPRDSVWRALVAGYTDVGLLPEVADTSTWVVARMNVPMSEALIVMTTFLS